MTRVYGTCVVVYMWKSEGSAVETVLSYAYTQFQVERELSDLGSKRLSCRDTLPASPLPITKFLHLDSDTTSQEMGLLSPDGGVEPE